MKCESVLPKLNLKWPNGIVAELSGVGCFNHITICEMLLDSIEIDNDGEVSMSESGAELVGRLIADIKGLQAALVDTVNRPMGVIPASAEPYWRDASSAFK